jgi:hypothetical protein
MFIVGESFLAFQDHAPVEVADFIPEQFEDERLVIDAGILGHFRDAGGQVGGEFGKVHFGE